MPHFAARRITSASAFDGFMTETVAGGGITRCFVVAGDPSHPLGPFPDSASLIATSAFERCGVETIGIGGHPEGHPVMSEAECWTILVSKCRSIEERGMSPMINWRKGGGAARMIDISKREHFYQQEYCGSVYSLRDTNAHRVSQGRPEIEIGKLYYGKVEGEDT